MKPEWGISKTVLPGNAPLAVKKAYGKPLCYCFYAQLVKQRYYIIFFIVAELKKLKKELQRTKSASFAEGTRKNLKSQWKSFILFCLYFQLAITHPSIHVLELYVQFLSRSLKCAQSIWNYISAVKLLYNVVGSRLPEECWPRLALVIRGCKRIKPHTPRQAEPITPAILFQIYQLLNLKKDRDLTNVLDVV